MELVIERVVTEHIDSVVCGTIPVEAVRPRPQRNSFVVRKLSLSIVDRSKVRRIYDHEKALL
jgi:hypothetical protein